MTIAYRQWKNFQDMRRVTDMFTDTLHRTNKVWNEMEEEGLFKQDSLAMEECSLLMREGSLPEGSLPEV